MLLVLSMVSFVAGWVWCTCRQVRFSGRKFLSRCWLLTADDQEGREGPAFKGHGEDDLGFGRAGRGEEKRRNRGR